MPVLCGFQIIQWAQGQGYLCPLWDSGSRQQAIRKDARGVSGASSARLVFLLFLEMTQCGNRNTTLHLVLTTV